MSVKAIVQLYPVIPAEGGAAGRAARRPLGRDRDEYQKIMRDWAKIAKAAEDLGYWGIAGIEHHFHSEGYEVAPAPGVINAWLGAQTSRINIGTNGYPLGTHDAIRVAEECAVLDHMLEGRFWAGVSRGYQSRWTDVLGQHLGVQATLSDGSAIDQANRDIFEEQLDLMLKAWTEDSFDFKGSRVQVPFPYDTGIVGYPGVDVTARMGALDEVDEHGAIRKISVTPPPYQRPHPPVFVASSSSEESIRYCARNGFVVCSFSPASITSKFAQIYADEAAKAGHPVPLGANQAPVRWPHITDSAAAYDKALMDYDADIFENFYAKFFKKKMPVGADVLQGMKDSGLFLGGTVDQAKAQFAAEWEQVPYEYSVLIWHWAQQPVDDLIREMELMATKVYPEIGGLAGPEERPRAQWATT
ncbi:LLM class flavin-dependent oxidoreductase [Nonomuraea glycinis]|uniref:LLM class flavin-dependent oxidoreductase n=1 Tax=Nonomuraea glycinis TaxID=2047744 RepID=UPI002E122E0E|nr:LLM class flavin-dependent oxidoreductase [Nonomuraea glycinis]